jgi:ribosomal protein S6--L-glutamate ligase
VNGRPPYRQAAQLAIALYEFSPIAECGVITHGHEKTSTPLYIPRKKAQEKLDSVYCEIFQAAGLDVFPRNYYHFLGDKIAQTDLFNLLGIPHPRTRIYYGGERSGRIESDFSYPFVAKTPIGSSQGEGVFLIDCREELSQYLRTHNPAYIQERLPIERDLRVVAIGGALVHAYWRIHAEGDFRNNVSQGGTVSFEDIPAEALDFGMEVARRCGFDEVGLDICEHAGKYCVLEANMVFGQEGFRKKGLDIHQMIADLFDSGE